MDYSNELPTSFWLIYGVMFIAVIAGYWKVFEKAGQPGWAALIPFYNVIVMLKIIGKPWWWLLLLLIPIVNFVILIWMFNLLSKSFGKGEGFTVGLVLLTAIFILILGFGDARYQGPAGAGGAAESNLV